MRSYVLLVMSSLFLSGCIKYVEVPVWVCPEPNIPQREVLTSKGITDKSTTDDILRSFVYDVTAQDIYIEQLLSILNGYKQKPALPIQLNRYVPSGK